jgi:uncharacterized delta-60 repeat protein
MKRIILAGMFFLSFTSFMSLNAQWARTYGGSNSDVAYSIQQTSDGGYIVAGETISFGAGSCDIWVLKLNSAGNIEWQRTYGGSDSDEAHSVQQTSDGGYIVAGDTWSFGSIDHFGAKTPDFWVLKINSAGDIEWQRTYPSSFMEGASSIQQTKDGGYIVAGRASHYSPKFSSIWVLKLNSAGRVEWKGSYCSGFEGAYSIQQTGDEGYIVAGYSLDGGILVLKLNSEGDIEWQRTYGESDRDKAHSVQQTSDGGYIVAGWTYSFGAGGSDFWVLKLNSEGDIEWQKTYGGSEWDCASSIQQTNDGGYIVAGETISFGAGSSDIWVLKLNSAGDIEWQKTYGGSSGDRAYSIQQTSDGGYTVAGETESFGAGKLDILILKLKPNGDIDPSCEFIRNSNATVSDTDIIPKDTYMSSDVGGWRSRDTNISPQDTTATVYLLCPRLQGVISLSPSSLNFGATTTGYKTTDQYFRIINTGSGILTWSVEDNADWLICLSTSGTGDGKVTVSVNSTGLLPGTYTAIITVYSPEAYNSPQYVIVTLRIYESWQERAPFGWFDTPVDGSTVSGSVAVTGWALDDIEVTRIEIKRNSHPDDPSVVIGHDGLVYIGDGVFVKGARPDVEAAYPDYPRADRAGWGYMMLTNFLPNQGNGTFTIYAFAYDGCGHRVGLGTKTIICDNAHRVKPFGTIDTPTQGGMASGTVYMNFGWALTPLPKMIPLDGSTIRVFIDSVPVGHPVYNQRREDIATLFPGYANSDGAVGYYYIDTTQYANGVHNIAWSVTDNEGEVDGIGSRFFEIQNVSGGTAAIAPIKIVHYLEDTSGRLRIEVKGMTRGIRPSLYWQRGQEEQELQVIGTERPGEIQIEELERIEIHFKGEGGVEFIGWGVDKWKDLPIGSTLDSNKGIFYWMPGPGFLGKHVLHFAVTNGQHRSKPVKVVVNIVPKKY